MHFHPPSLYYVVARQLVCGSNGKLGVGSNATSPDSGTSVSPGQAVLDTAVFPRQHPLVPGPRANVHALGLTNHTSDASWVHTQETVCLPFQCSIDNYFVSSLIVTRMCHCALQWVPLHNQLLPTRHFDVH